jgi:hypothetical protein
MVKVCPASWDGLAGESPVRVVAKQPGSWRPAEGEIRPSKRRDKAPSGGEQAASPYDEEPCGLDTVTMWEPSPSPLGEGHERREDLGVCSAVPTGVRGAEWLHSPSRNRRDPSRHRQYLVAACQAAVPGKREAYKQLDCEVAERRAEVGAGRSSDERRKNRNRRSEGPVVRRRGGPADQHRGDARRALTSTETEVRADEWDLAVFGHPGTVSFTAISQRWLREAAKRWAAEDLPRRRVRAGRRTSAGLSVRHHIGAVARLSESLRMRPDRGEIPASLGRAEMEAFLRRLAFLESTGQLSTDARIRAVREVRTVLTRVRAAGLPRPGGVAGGLGEDFTLWRAAGPVGLGTPRRRGVDPS